METISSFLFELLKTLAAASVLLGIIAFIGKSWIKQYLAKDLEKVKQDYAKDLVDYKEKLSRETGAMLAQVKHGYDLDAMRYSRFYERLTEVSADVYMRLLDVKTNLHMYVEFPQKDEETFERVMECREAFGESFYNREIVFPKKVSECIRNLDTKFDRAWRLMHYVDERGLSRPKDMQQWQEAKDIMKTEVPPLFDKAHSELRTLIGAKDSLESIPKSNGGQTI